MVTCMVAGTAVIMWLGELITERGIGNGMSILIFTQVVAVFPSEFWSIYTRKGGFVFALVVVTSLAVMAGVVFVEQAQRRIPVQYAKRVVGRRWYGGTSTYIPLKVNQAGVIPAIFASSLLYVPALAAQLWPRNTFLNRTLAPLTRQDDPWHMAALFGLIVFFTYFYVAITFNPTEIADNMKKYGGLVPGIRPGRPTAGYLDYVLDPDHRARGPLPGADLADPDGGAVTVRRHAGLPVRRDQSPDRRRRRAGHREADREPAAAGTTTRGSSGSHGRPPGRRPLPGGQPSVRRRWSRAVWRRPAPARADRGGQGPGGADQHDELLGAGDGGVQQVTLQHHPGARGERDDDGRVLAALRTVDRHGVRVGELVQLVEVVVDAPRPRR